MIIERFLNVKKRVYRKVLGSNFLGKKKFNLKNDI